MTGHHVVLTVTSSGTRLFRAILHPVSPKLVSSTSFETTQMENVRVMPKHTDALRVQGAVFGGGEQRYCFMGLAKFSQTMRQGERLFEFYMPEVHCENSNSSCMMASILFWNATGATVCDASVHFSPAMWSDIVLTTSGIVSSTRK